MATKASAIIAAIDRLRSTFPAVISEAARTAIRAAVTKAGDVEVTRMARLYPAFSQAEPEAVPWILESLLKQLQWMCVNFIMWDAVSYYKKDIPGFARKQSAAYLAIANGWFGWHGTSSGFVSKDSTPRSDAKALIKAGLCISAIESGMTAPVKLIQKDVDRIYRALDRIASANEEMKRAFGNSNGSSLKASPSFSLERLFTKLFGSSSSSWTADDGKKAEEAIKSVLDSLLGDETVSEALSTGFFQAVKANNADATKKLANWATQQAIWSWGGVVEDLVKDIVLDSCRELERPTEYDVFVGSNASFLIGGQDQHWWPDRMLYAETHEEMGAWMSAIWPELTEYDDLSKTAPTVDVTASKNWKWQAGDEATHAYAVALMSAAHPAFGASFVQRAVDIGAALRLMTPFRKTTEDMLGPAPSAIGTRPDHLFLETISAWAKKTGKSADEVTAELQSAATSPCGATVKYIDCVCLALGPDGFPNLPPNSHDAVKKLAALQGASDRCQALHAKLQTQLTSATTVTIGGQSMTVADALSLLEKTKRDLAAETAKVAAETAKLATCNVDLQKCKDKNRACSQLEGFVTDFDATVNTTFTTMADRKAFASGLLQIYNEAKKATKQAGATQITSGLQGLSQQTQKAADLQAAIDDALARLDSDAGISGVALISDVPAAVRSALDRARQWAITQADLDQAIAKQKTAETEAQRCQRDLGSLQAKYDTEKRELQATLTDLRQEIESSRREKDALNLEASNLKAGEAAVKAALGLSQSDALIDKAIPEIAALKSQGTGLPAVEAERDRLDQRVKQLEADVAAAAAALAAERDKTAKAIADAAALEATKDAALQTKDGIIAQKDADIARLNALVTASSPTATVSSAVAALKAQIDSLQRSNAALVLQKTTANTETSKIKSLLEKCEADARSAKDSATDAAKTAHEALKARDDLIMDKKKELDDSIAEIQRLQAEVSQEKGRQTELASELALVKADLTSIRVELDDARHATDVAVQKSIKDASDRSALAQADARIAQIQRELDEANSRGRIADALNDEIKLKNEGIARLKRDGDRHAEVLARYQAKIEELQARILQLDKDLAVVRGNERYKFGDVPEAVDVKVEVKGAPVGAHPGSTALPDAWTETLPPDTKALIKYDPMSVDAMALGTSCYGPGEKPAGCGRETSVPCTTPEQVKRGMCSYSTITVPIDAESGSVLTYSVLDHGSKAKLQLQAAIGKYNEARAIMMTNAAFVLDKHLVQLLQLPGRNALHQSQAVQSMSISNATYARYLDPASSAVCRAFLAHLFGKNHLGFASADDAAAAGVNFSASDPSDYEVHTGLFSSLYGVRSGEKIDSARLFISDQYAFSSEADYPLSGDSYAHRPGTGDALKFNGGYDKLKEAARHLMNATEIYLSAVSDAGAPKISGVSPAIPAGSFSVLPRVDIDAMLALAVLFPRDPSKPNAPHLKMELDTFLKDDQGSPVCMARVATCEVLYNYARQLSQPQPEKPPEQRLTPENGADLLSEAARRVAEIALMAESLDQ
jgi:hypothetical protein